MKNSAVALPDNAKMHASQTQQLSEKKSMMVGVNARLSDMHNQNV